jgi:integrase
MPEDSDAAGQYIEPSQFAALLTHLPDKLQPFFKFLYHTGCRIGAAKEISWPMVSLDASVIKIPAALMKARKPLTVVLAGKGLEPVAKELKKMFRQNGDRVFYIANYRAEWQKACHKVGLGVRDKNRQQPGDDLNFLVLASLFLMVCLLNLSRIPAFARQFRSSACSFRSGVDTAFAAL